VYGGGGGGGGGRRRRLKRGRDGKTFCEVKRKYITRTQMELSITVTFGFCHVTTNASVSSKAYKMKPVMRQYVRIHSKCGAPIKIAFSVHLYAHVKQLEEN
jgi:hypothetical protein